MFQITNYKPHPRYQTYTVFFFGNHDQGNYFEALLKEKKIPYEKDESDDGRDLLLFAIHRNHIKQAHKANYLASAKYRKPFMPEKAFRYTVLFITLIAILLAIIGFLISG